MVIELSNSSISLFGCIEGPNKNRPNCGMLDNWVFDNFILADKPFAKALRIFETYLSVKNNLWGKVVSLLELRLKFDERFKGTPFQFLIPDINLLS